MKCINTIPELKFVKFRKKRVKNTYSENMLVLKYYKN